MLARKSVPVELRYMSLPQTIIDLENRYVGKNGEPTLGRALELAEAEWRSGNSDRELRLHLLFLIWYCNVEPPFLTGFNESATPGGSLALLFHDIYETFAGEILDDVECLCVVGLMASIAPWALGGDAAMWEARSETFKKRYRILLPEGLSPVHFEGRGAYGDYFSGQVAVPGGF
jgi:hypothetical protein